MNSTRMIAPRRVWLAAMLMRHEMVINFKCLLVEPSNHLYARVISPLGLPDSCRNNEPEKSFSALTNHPLASAYSPSRSPKPRCSTGKGVSRTRTAARVRDCTLLLILR